MGKMAFHLTVNSTVNLTVNPTINYKPAGGLKSFFRWLACAMSFVSGGRPLT